MTETMRLPNGKLDQWQVGLAFLTVLMVLAMGILSYWTIFDEPVAAEIYETRVLTPTVTQGDILRFDVNYCKYTGHDAVLDRNFRDGLLFSTPTGLSTNIPKGCGSVIIGVEIPNSLPPSDYYMDVTLTYHVNPISHRVVKYSVGPFSVTGGRNARLSQLAD